MLLLLTFYEFWRFQFFSLNISRFIFPLFFNGISRYNLILVNTINKDLLLRLYDFRVFPLLTKGLEVYWTETLPICDCIVKLQFTILKVLSTHFPHLYLLIKISNSLSYLLVLFLIFTLGWIQFCKSSQIPIFIFLSFELLIYCSFLLNI